MPNTVVNCIYPVKIVVLEAKSASAKIVAGCIKAYKIATNMGRCVRILNGSWGKIHFDMAP